MRFQDSLHRKYIVHTNNINILDAPVLELFVFLYVSGYLGTAGPRKCTRDSNLTRVIDGSKFELVALPTTKITEVNVQIDFCQKFLQM